jgi:hypothetical protein
VDVDAKVVSKAISYITKGGQPPFVFLRSTELNFYFLKIERPIWIGRDDSKKLEADIPVG